MYGKLLYILIRLQQKEGEALEYFEEGNTSQPSLSQKSSLSLCINPKPLRTPHMDRLVSSEVMRFSLKEMLLMNIGTDGRFGTRIASLGMWASPP